ncbi:uncharacterized protein LOC119737166 [Patiria miniata]|uniref:Netrin receptor UNC5 n=1 Tax=Patiria miniata TaxID=46514 RepID=A0A914AVA5_PATMI|nr:uncharacterized protein LOC119737166 [Patiria miniata]
MSTQRHASVIDNLGMTGDETSSREGSRMYMYFDDQGGSVSAHYGGLSFEGGPGLDNNVSMPRTTSVISLGNDSGLPPTPSPSVSRQESEGSSSNFLDVESPRCDSIDSAIDVTTHLRARARAQSMPRRPNHESPRCDSIDSAIDVTTHLRARARAKSMPRRPNHESPRYDSVDSADVTTHLRSRARAQSMPRRPNHESPRCDSVDSANVTTHLRARARARSAQRCPNYEPIVSVVMEDRGAEPSTSAEGVQELQVQLDCPDQPQQPAPETTYIDQIENTVDSSRLHPALRFIRGILRLLTVCITCSRARSIGASCNNQAHLEVAEVVDCRSANPEKSSPLSQSVVLPLEAAPPLPSTPSLQPSPSPPSSPSTPFGSPAQFSCALSRKDEFLSSFDRICSKAKAAGLYVVGRVIQVDNFAAAMLDSHGGCLSIETLDVHLFIPPGAIPADESPKRVYIYVQGSLTSGRSHLTPYVYCGPSGFHFRKDVFLTLPHCAKDVLDKQFTFEKSTSEGTESIQDPADGIVLVDSDSLTLSMDHFCGIGAFGEINAKSMLVCPFIRQSSDAEEVDIHVRVFDNMKINLQEVESEENAIGFVLAGPPQELVVQKTDPAVVAKISSIVEPWKMISHPESSCCEQTIQSQYLWRVYSQENVRAFPCKPFCARNSSSSVLNPFRAVLEVFPAERKEHQVEFILRVPTNGGFKQKPCEALDDLMWRQMESPSTCDTGPWLDQDICESICNMLDKPNPLGKDWRHLPELLFVDREHGHSWVEGVEKRAYLQKCSPTKYVLNAFVTASRKKGKETTLRELVKGLSKMCCFRPDLEPIKKQLQQCEQNNNKDIVDECPEFALPNIRATNFHCTCLLARN